MACRDRLAGAARHVSGYVWQNGQPTGRFYELDEFNARLDVLTAALASC